MIVSAKRTPVTSFNKTLAKLTAPQLGSIAIKSAVESAGIQFSQVQEVFMGIHFHFYLLKLKLKEMW